ncbi:hypothetical protein [Paenarthrobacter sp.]|uniref:hypothetical protein n=1 Tax=Paenarthrobacter sp. TaxID=1931993 RepID=UPI00281152F5|nr:hypothetical protein [Paenarthrobacter sp.]
MTILAESTPSSEEVEITTVAWAKPLEEAADLRRVGTASSGEPFLDHPSSGLNNALDQKSDSGNNESTRHDII